jgi:tRNA uridine 5-carbamoylmethylation protein Kti12
MDQLTQGIINAILETQNSTGILGDSISVPNAQVKVKTQWDNQNSTRNPFYFIFFFFFHLPSQVTLKRQITLAELRRLKKQFIKMNSQNQLTTREAIADNFVIFINNLT